MKPNELLRATLHPSIVQLPNEGEFPSLEGATGWLNTAPLTPAGLRGKVVLASFWTFTCVNWRRTQPYLHAWADKYKDMGLVVLGIHTPEFEFEKDIENVRREAKAQGVEYPIVLDSNYAIWRAFDNHYWPALYFIDAQGVIRFHHFGESDYDQSEMMLQQLLMRAGVSGIGDGLAPVEPTGAEVAADWGSVRSPESYVGYAQGENLASPEQVRTDHAQDYTAPARVNLNEWALVGNWTVGRQATALNKPNGRIVFRFHARDVNLVMGPPKQGAVVRFRVLLDGQAPGAAHGVDIDAQGNGTADAQRMYQLIRQPKPIADRTFEIEFLDAGVETFVFTFG